MTKVIVLFCHYFREVLVFCALYSSLELYVLHIYYTLLWFGVNRSHSVILCSMCTRVQSVPCVPNGVSFPMVIGKKQISKAIKKSFDKEHQLFIH